MCNNPTPTNKIKITITIAPRELLHSVNTNTTISARYRRTAYVREEGEERV
jgi:hypothetical protein